MGTPHDPRRTSPGDGDAGVRVIEKHARPRFAAWATGALALCALALATLAWWPRDGRSSERGHELATAPGTAVAGSQRTAASDAIAPVHRVDARARAAPAEPLPGNDPTDLASYFRPGDPEPTGREVIEALHEAGVRTGIGAFNPPGTSPPIAGLAVPADFALPPGYVRHHQVTDDGVPLEPILMFAPGFVLADARGRALPMPADRVVTPALAPPGLPLRRIAIPTRP